MSQGAGSVSGDPILDAINDVKTEVRGVRQDVSAVNRELGGVQATLQNIEKGNERRDKELKDIRDQQSNCAARTGVDGVNARLKKLERADQDITGNIDVVSQRQQALELGMKNKRDTGDIKLGDAFKRVFPWFIVSVLGGVGVIAFILAYFFIKL